jgi:signal transduction histidine kinase
LNNLKQKFAKFFSRFKRRETGFRARFSALARTTTFKVATSFAALFLTFSLLLLGYVWVVSFGLLSFEADKAAKKEMQSLTMVWQNQGVDALNAALIQRAASNNDNLYVLITPQGDILSGNIDAIPMDLSNVQLPKIGTTLADSPLYQTSFTYSRDETKGQKRAARGVFLASFDGFGLFVAHDLGAGFAVAARVVNAVLGGSLAVLAFAIIGGYYAARGAARRVDELSRTTKKVMAGDLTVRAPINDLKIGSGDEFDILTDDLNNMLDRTERLVQASRTIGDAIAHDLRSPLTRLRVKLEDANIHAKNQDDLHEAIDVAIEDVDKIVTTFNAVLRLSRLEAGQGAIRENFDLSQTLNEIAEIFEYSFEDKELGFSADIEENLIINADKSLLIQAITNLLDNALKYTQTGEVRLVARKIEKRIHIKIIDTGLGIIPALRQKALKRFERLDAARTTQGSGIGLSLALAIAEAHDGELILSDGLVRENGVGLCVTIII